MRIVAFALLTLAAFATNAPAQPTLGGHVEIIQALRIEDNAAYNSSAFEHPYPRSEARAQFTLSQTGDVAALFVRADAVSDWRGYEANETDLDLREAYIRLTLARWLQLKAGRQVATWGTGDLIFCNDLFAKDWDAFFTGLDDTYLKLPQALLRLSMQRGNLSYDAAISPRFTPDQFPEPSRISYPQSALYLISSKHPEWFQRLSLSAGSIEAAVYSYWGHWPTPQGIHPAFFDSYAFHPELASLGASVRFPVESYLVSVEIADYLALDDSDGDDPYIANSQIRGFIGVEKSLGREWTAGSQYYAEWMMDYDQYRVAVQTGMPVYDEVRSTWTFRLTKLARHQTVQFSVFGYWGITDGDWHLRPSTSYDVSDGLKLTIGASLLDGEEPHSTFGQFRDNSNIFSRLRYSF